MRKNWMLTTLALGTGALGCGEAPSSSQPPPTQVAAMHTEPTFAFTVDTQLLPTIRSVQGQHGARSPVGAYADDSGVTSELVTDELLVYPRNEQELRAFLARTGGEVVGTNAVPEPPEGRGIALKPSFREPTAYVVRVDATRFPLDHFRAEAAKRGLRGLYRFSSMETAHVVALATHERLKGVRVMPNFVMQPNSMLHRTEEGPKGNGFINAFDYSCFKSQLPLHLGNRSTVTQAWQFLAGRGNTQPVNVAILDAGFWLDEQGHPFNHPSGPGTDLPLSPVQYDFIDEDYFAGEKNPEDCKGVDACIWHGNNSASVATGILNNHAAIAGTGGQVAQPMLFKVAFKWNKVEWAVRTATAWGANVISMSFGGSCNADCRDHAWTSALYASIKEARDAGVVLVASAGNKTQDVGSVNVVPCTIPGVICVGALADDSKLAHPNSNYGNSVDIWAPTNIPTMPNEATFPAPALATGTSASAPFISGIAAMMKSVNPGLTSDDVRDLLVSTGSMPYSPDPKVTAYVDAYRAVLQASGGQISQDAREPNDTPTTATPLVPGVMERRTLHNSTDTDYYRLTLSDYAEVSIEVEHMVGLGNIVSSLQPESVSGYPTNITLTKHGRGFRYDTGLLPPGTYLLRLNTSSPQPYYLQASVTNKGLQPDKFEPDDTFATAVTPLAVSSHEVNLHDAKDVDYYAFDVPPMNVLQGYAFDIAPAEMPLKVSVYKSDGTLVSTEAPSRRHRIELDTGKWVVKVSGEGRGRYIFSAGLYDRVKAPYLVAIDKWWWLDIFGPVQRWLVDVEEGFSFDMHEGLSMLRLTGTGLHASVLDVEGQVMTESKPLYDEQGTQVGELLSLEKLQPGRHYFIHVARAESGDPKEALPVLGFRLELLGQK